AIAVGARIGQGTAVRAAEGRCARVRRRIGGDRRLQVGALCPLLIERDLDARGRVRDRLSIVEVRVAIRGVEERLRGRDCCKSEEEARDCQGCGYGEREYRSMSHGRLPLKNRDVHADYARFAPSNADDADDEEPLRRYQASQRANSSSQLSLPSVTACPAASAT